MKEASHRIEIVTQTNGTRSVFRARCNCSQAEDGRIRVTYDEDGDGVQLIFDRDSLLMSRTGATALRAEFSLQRRTVMQIRGEGGEGEVPVETKRYRFRSVRGEFLIELLYRLLFLNDSQTFLLNLSVLNSEEK